ncbi:MAG: hypothetical protein AAGF87_05975 [Bacteroidota bacterium]
MSHTPTQVRDTIHRVCMASYQRQLDLLQSAQLVSAPTSRENLQLLLHANAVSTQEPLPDISDEKLTAFTDMETEIEQTQTTDDLRNTRNSLISWLSEFHGEDFSEETVENSRSTDLGLNKRMRDELFLTRGKIRSTRRRLKDSGQDYDHQAYVSTRNQLLFVQRTYLEQLRMDLAKATHEGIAQVERILHPAILEATGDTFVASLSNLRDFILEQISAPAEV